LILEKITENENPNFVFKPSFRHDIKLKQSNPKVLENVISKTIAAFMNSEGDTLVIGIENDYQLVKKKIQTGLILKLDNRSLA
jgi:predicted HTH transcriptional regulator